MTNADSDNSREWAAQAYALLKKRQEEQKQELEKQEEQKQELEKQEEQKQELEKQEEQKQELEKQDCLLYTSPSPRDRTRSRMPSSA